MDDKVYILYVNIKSQTGASTRAIDSIHQNEESAKIKQKILMDSKWIESSVYVEAKICNLAQDAHINERD